MRQIIIVPGLGDNRMRMQLLTRNWNLYGFKVHYFKTKWKKEPNIQDKIQRLVGEIDKVTKNGEKVTLIGTSAGGSLALNAFIERKNKIHKVITVCGRLKKGEKGFPSLKLAARGYPAFYDSVMLSGKIIKTLTPQEKKKILTIQPFLFDGVVPINCMYVPGAKAKRVIFPTHFLGIFGAIAFYKNTLFSFIEKN